MLSSFLKLDVQLAVSIQQKELSVGHANYHLLTDGLERLNFSRYIQFYFLILKVTAQFPVFYGCQQRD